MQGQSLDRDQPTSEVQLPFRPEWGQFYLGRDKIVVGDIVVATRDFVMGLPGISPHIVDGQEMRVVGVNSQDLTYGNRPSTRGLTVRVSEADPNDYGLRGNQLEWVRKKESAAAD